MACNATDFRNILLHDGTEAMLGMNGATLIFRKPLLELSAGLDRTATAATTTVRLYLSNKT